MGLEWDAGKVHALIERVAPCKGAAINKGQITYALEDHATNDQKTAARAVVDGINLANAPVDADAERIKEILAKFETATAAEKWEAVGKFLRKHING